MSDNNISLYTLKPTTTSAPTVSPTTLTPVSSASTSTTVYPQHYSPLRLKVSISNKSAYFTPYNLPASLPINGYMTYQLNGVQYTYNIYPISNNSNLSQSSGFNASEIFDTDSNDNKFSLIQPISCYLDFSEFNKVSYNKDKTFSYYRSTYFNQEKYNQSINPYEYISDVSASEVMMKNINWANDDCTRINYIGIGNLYKYLFSEYTLKDPNNTQILKDNWLNFINGTGNTLSQNPVWPNDTVAGESACAPVSWEDSRSFIYFTKDKMYFNGFPYLWNVSKIDRTDSILADYYSKSNNTAWISELMFYNADVMGRFNREKYFLVYDTMPQQYKIRNEVLSYINGIWMDADGGLPDTNPFQFTWDNGLSILENIYFKLKLYHPTQNLPDANYIPYKYETNNITISPVASKMELTTHLFHLDSSNTTYLDYKKAIQFKEYEVNLNTYLGRTIDNTICDNSRLYLELNRYSNTDRNDFSNYGNTLFPIKYKFNESSSTYYVSYVDYKICCDIVNQYTHREIISYSGQVDIISDKLNSLNSPNIYNISYSGLCSLRFTDGYDSAKQTYLVISSINPKIRIDIAHTSQKIFFKYNGHEYNAKEKDGFIKNKTTIYSKINTNFDKIIDNVFAESAVLPSKHIKYVYVDGAWSYLEYVTYANCEYGEKFYNTSITIDLENVNHYSKPGADAGIYCWVDKIGEKANVTIDSTNNKIVVNNINWYDADSGLQDIVVNFEKVTAPPKPEDKYIEYHFGKNTPDDINMSVNYNSAIISANNTTIGYLLTNGTVESPVLTLPIDGNNISETVYINTGFYTDIYNQANNNINPAVCIYKPNNNNNNTTTKLTYYNDYNCEIASTLKFKSNSSSSPSEQLLSDGGKAITVTNDILNPETKNIAYLNAYLLFNNELCMNILPNDYMDTVLLGYYQSSYKNSGGNTILFIDNVNSNEISLPAGTVFSEDITLYTKLFTAGSKIDCLYYPLIDKPNSISQSSLNQSVLLTDNVSTLNNIKINDYINTPKQKPHNLRTISFDTATTPLKFTISAYMTGLSKVDYGYINYNGTVQSINLADENTSYTGRNYNNELIDNRFMLMNKSIPLYDITHETLKYIAKQYKCNYYNYPYTTPVGIDVYFHPYYAELGIIAPGGFDCTHWYSKNYENTFTKHYIYDIPIAIEYNKLKELPITNIQYVIKNDTISNVTIDGINYNQGDYIYLKPSSENSLSVWDLVNVSIGEHAGIGYSSFRDYILTEYYYKEQNNKILSVSINEIKIDENKYSLFINDKWLNKETGNIEVNLSKIRDITNFDKKYNITNNYSLANINLSDIITVNNKNLIYLEPIYLGFNNERFDIFNTTSTNDSDKYNSKWKNLLTFIETSTDYKLDPELYKQMRITSFSILNFVQPNCKLLIDDDYNNISTQDGNVIWDGNANGTDELKNIYNLYLSDNKKLKTLDNRISNSTKFSYKIILSNYTFVLNCKLFKTANTPEKDGIDISFKFTLGNSDITTTAITLDKNNTLNFGTFYITDKQLAYIKNDQPGYLWFDPISNNPSDDYEVRITFWDENQKEIKSTPAGTIVIKNGIAKKWNMIEYINNNIDKNKKVNYISINYIRANSGTDIEKYVLKPKV